MYQILNGLALQIQFQLIFLHESTQTFKFNKYIRTNESTRTIIVDGMFQFETDESVIQIKEFKELHQLLLLGMES